jgi:hypothetical protein
VQSVELVNLGLESYFSTFIKSSINTHVYRDSESNNNYLDTININFMQIWLNLI